MGQDQCPYVEGGWIVLRAGVSSGVYHEIHAQIIRLFTPFTLSVVMVVCIDSSEINLKGPVALKLFERRFLPEFRKDVKVESWTDELERSFEEYVLSGRAAEFLQELRASRGLAEEKDEPWSLELDDDWALQQDEVYAYSEMRRLYGMEVEAYRRARNIQGVFVPELLLCVTSASNKTLVDANDYASEGLECPGVLLEYIEGFNLFDLASNAPREKWQQIGDDAIRIVHIIGDLGILNNDVQLRNFMVRNNQDNNFQVFMIDFASCKFRNQAKSENEWRKWKAHQDEEGAVGYVLQTKMDGGFVYRISDLYERLSIEFVSATPEVQSESGSTLDTTPDEGFGDEGHNTNEKPGTIFEPVIP